MGMQDIPLDTKKRRPSSRVLQEIIRQTPAEYVTVGWLTSHRHSFGIVLLCLGLLATTPLGSTLPGLILAVMAAQMIAGRTQPVFPRFFSSSLGNNHRRSSHQRLIGVFGGSLCNSSGHSSSISSRITSETSGRHSVSSRNLCSRSKSSCTMI